MKSCGLIVEYNPFHNGHVFHFEQSKAKTNADVVIAVMSGSFLQRGEPAIIDKFHRTKAALEGGIDLVIELPFVYSCQYADLFAKGAIMTLSALGVQTVCFGSEKGDIQPFLNSYMHFKQNEDTFQLNLQNHLSEGLSFPQASTKAYETINLTTSELNLSQPNNILGFSYVKAIKDLNLHIKPETIQRTKSGYHDETIEHEIASATSVRKEIIKHNEITNQAEKALPSSTVKQLKAYRDKTNVWHDWELYFSMLQYLVKVKSIDELKNIHGMIEGLEYRLKQTANEATSFAEWMELVKTKRYTWTRLQRVFVHLLTHTTRSEIEYVQSLNNVPYIRILGMSQVGRSFIQVRKKKIDIPLISNIQQFNHPILSIEERATDAYYLPLSPNVKKAFRKQELTGPILFDHKKS